MVLRQEMFRLSSDGCMKLPFLRTSWMRPAALDINPKRSTPHACRSYIPDSFSVARHKEPTSPYTLTPPHADLSLFGSPPRFASVRSFTPPSSNIPVQKWRSSKTGLSFVWAGVEGPIVNGTFTVPTEIFVRSIDLPPSFPLPPPF
jgi:hypothetical protein